MANFKRRKSKKTVFEGGVRGLKCSCCVYRFKGTYNRQALKAASERRKLDAAAAALKEEF